MSQYTIISKHGKRTRQLKFKKELKIFPQETMAAGENRFAPQLNEKEVIELLEQATPGSIQKRTKCGMKTFQGKNLKLYFDNLSIRVSQSKTMQVETIYTFKLSVHCNIRFLLTKESREDLSNWGVFNKTIIPLALVGYEIIMISIISHPTRARGIIVKYTRQP